MLSQVWPVVSLSGIVLINDWLGMAQLTDDSPLLSRCFWVVWANRLSSTGNSHPAELLQGLCSCYLPRWWLWPERCEIETHPFVPKSLDGGVHHSNGTPKTNTNTTNHGSVNEDTEYYIIGMTYIFYVIFATSLNPSLVFDREDQTSELIYGR